MKTQLNPGKWRSYFSQYWDQQSPDLIEYGFPVDFDSQSDFVSSEVNHTSAIKQTEHIEEYISEELLYDALYDPFQETPIPVHISTLMTRAKQNSDKRCTIFNLS